MRKKLLYLWTLASLPIMAAVFALIVIASDWVSDADNFRDSLDGASRMGGIFIFAYFVLTAILSRKQSFVTIIGGMALIGLLIGRLVFVPEGWFLVTLIIAIVLRVVVAFSKTISRERKFSYLNASFSQLLLMFIIGTILHGSMFLFFVWIY